MRFRSLLAPSCLAAALALTPTPGSADAWVPAPKEFANEVRFSVFSARDFHGADGGRRALAGGGNTEERQLTSWNEYGWGKNTSAVIAIPLVSATRTFSDGSSFTTTGAGDLYLGLRHRLAGGARSVLSIEAGWKAPLGYDGVVRRTRAALAADDTTVARDLVPADSANAVRQLAPPRLGQGQQDVQGLLLFGLTMPGWRSFFEAAAGYRYRFDDPSDQILLGGDLGLWITDRLLLSGHYAGTIALNEDDLDADGYQEQLVGPRLTVRVDDGLDMFAGSMHTPGAENAPHKDLFYVGFTMKQTGLDRFQGFLGGTKKP